jgi:hypothetical protein
LVVLIGWWKPFGVTMEWMLIKESTKWTMWDYPMMQKVKCLMPSFRWVTHSWIILQEVFPTSMNLGKFSIWNELCGSLSFCTNQLGIF